jgi:hypothetical protein
VEFGQRFADGLGDGTADGHFVVEFHLAFGGVNVHVHVGWIEFDEKAADRVAAFHQ